MNEIRNKELKAIKKFQYLTAVGAFSWTCAPFIVRSDYCRELSYFVEICTKNILINFSFESVSLLINVTQFSVIKVALFVSTFYCV